MTDKITVLETVGPCLTKVYKSDGTTDAYDDAASFKVKTVEVADLPALAALLGKLHKNKKRCLIAGAPKDEMQPGNVQGSVTRTNANFDDQPLHSFVIDIDGYRPGFADPVLETELAVLDFLAEKLPPCFRTASFYWHLSSSAGMPGKEGILKCHLWMWSKTAYTTAQMYEWAKAYTPAIDKAVYRRVQIRYTADPIFEEGRTDPVPVRSGWHQGETDYVDLVITQDTLAQARDQGAGQAGNDMKLVDPSEKSGLVGLYNKIFTAEEVLLTHLEGEFEQVSERRYTWLNGGGTPEGTWVHDDGMHVGSSHNTWPIDGIANLWDLVRVFKFGHLDESDDAFEQEDIDSLPINAKPSNLAMLAWAGKLPELLEAALEERTGELDKWREEIADADVYTLENVIAPGIRQAKLSTVEREQVCVAFNARLGTVATKLPIGQVRKMLTPASAAVISPDAPDWAANWVWVTESDSFFNVDTKHLITERSYNAKYDRYMGRYADEDGNIPRASFMALTTWATPVVEMAMYSPQNPLIFSIDGLRCVNTYRSDLVPEMPESYSEGDLAAIATIDRHTAMLIPNELERTLFVDYLAYCVQHPGRKIRWAPVLKGIQGDGKSAFLVLMQHVLGHKNVRVLDSATLENSDFTAWRVGQCFTGLEEMKLHGHNRYDVYNKLKTPLSNDSVEMHPKGKDPITVPNVTNYLLLTNFDDGVPIDDSDRRAMCLRSPFLTKEELRAAIGSNTGPYFDNLFDVAIKRHAGALRKWLLLRELSPKFDPDGRAPETEARGLIVDMSRRDDDDAIASIIEDGGFGIYHNLIALSCLNDVLFNQHGIKLNSGRAKATLAAHGFNMWSDKQVKWRGKNYRFYYRGEKPVNAALLATQLEKEREAREVEGDFAD